MSIFDKIQNREYVNKMTYSFDTRDEYDDEGNRLFYLFKNDLESYFGQTGEPKADMLFEIACELARSRHPRPCRQVGGGGELDDSVL